MKKVALIVVLGLISVGLYAIDGKDSEKKAKEFLKKGDLKGVVETLSPVLYADTLSSEALFMLGYSNFHLGHFEEAIKSFSFLINKDVKFPEAFYYKGKAQMNLAAKYAWNVGKIKEDLMQDAIASFASAVELNPSEGNYLLSRGIAYMDYGIFKSQKFEETFNKRRAVNSLKLAIKNFEEVQMLHPSRHDITPLIKKATGYLEDLK